MNWQQLSEQPLAAIVAWAEEQAWARAMAACQLEGLYLRTESNGVVTGRAKCVRPEFVEKVKQSTHWQQQTMVPNVLRADVDIWS
jgi:hypothetical protein